ncbi:DUF4139 domain-containing protein [Zavarzinella formosa]|uniref:DUF4139 domain-containing protein n=1 Tax=Zavarzinella formosa TaxID=360055 RepID=UPI0002D2A139|nr:DUF4139 domain-containing protein [Zavarzinella formosa]
MFKKVAVGLFLSALVTAGVFTLRGDRTHAQTLTRAVQPPGEDAPVVNGQLKQAQKLPITQVVLFNSGVGYFSRSGEVEGDARVDLQFSAADINDLIKSLVIKDAKGKSVPLRYDSQEPIEKTLKSFAVDLSSNPSFGQILNQMRGQKVEITLQTNAPNLSGLPGNLTGVIIGMETAHRALTAASPTATEMELLNLSCVEGMRSVPLSAVQRIRFLNPSVENEFKRALEVVAIGHDSLKKTVHLGFQGEGKREVKVGYVVENPIWKTSYRMVKSDDGKWRLQAWANVENTSDDDWNDVKLTLVSSRPISFQMDLYPPLYIPRPTVEPALFASLRPPTYSGPVTNMAINAPNFGFQGGVGFGGGGVPPGFQNFAANTANLNNPMGQNPGLQQQLAIPMNGGLGQFGQVGGQFGGQFGNGINSFNNMNRYQNEKGLFVDNNNTKLSFEQLQARRNANNDPKQSGKVQAQQLGSALTNVDPEFMERMKAADELGQPARYSIDQKVSLPRQQSVMLPILDEEIDATKVSIYNERVHATRPLHGLKMKNKTKQALMSGPVTVYEGDQPYSGDARILDLQPGEERYLSYALDTGVEITSYNRITPGPEMTVKMEGGRLEVKYKQRHTKTYIIVNRSPESRKVILEQPIRTGWRLVSPEKPEETTTELYRFAVDVLPGKTVEYKVSEELPRVDPFSVAKQADWTGFATSLGLDVWTDVKRMPENGMTLQIINNQLHVTHKDRRSTTYFFRNNVDEDRTITLEHNVPADRHLIGDQKPVETGANRYQFKLELKKGATLSSAVLEEFRNAKPEIFQMQNIGRYATAPNVDQVVPPERFVTELGFDVWMAPRAEPQTTTNARFVKSMLFTDVRETESFVYHISNRTGDPQSFVLDHQVRPRWEVVGDAKPVEGLQRCVQYAVRALPNVVTKHVVSEQRTVPKQEKMTDITNDRMKEILAAPSVKAEVKENLKKVRAMVIASQQTEEEIKSLFAGTKSVTEEQARLRTNLEKLPPTSELYKRYITKLDESETALEKVQKQATDKAVAKAKLERELQDLLEKLSAE